MEENEVGSWCEEFDWVLVQRYLTRRLPIQVAESRLKELMPHRTANAASSA